VKIIVAVFAATALLIAVWGGLWWLALKKERKP
jgi:hypothetical protein